MSKSLVKLVNRSAWHASHTVLDITWVSQVGFLTLFSFVFISCSFYQTYLASWFICIQNTSVGTNIELLITMSLT